MVSTLNPQYSVTKEYLVFLKDEIINIFYNENELRSVSSKTNCQVILTKRILNRKIGEYKLIKYAIIQIKGKDESAIRQCNRLLEYKFPSYCHRQEYDKKTDCTLFPQESLPDNANLYYQYQRSGSTQDYFGKIILKSPFSYSKHRSSTNCVWKVNDKDLNKSVLVPSSRQTEKYFSLCFDKPTVQVDCINCNDDYNQVSLSGCLNPNTIPKPKKMTKTKPHIRSNSDIAQNIANSNKHFNKGFKSKGAKGASNNINNIKKHQQHPTKHFNSKVAEEEYLNMYETLENKYNLVQNTALISNDNKNTTDVLIDSPYLVSPENKNSDYEKVNNEIGFPGNEVSRLNIEMNLEMPIVNDEITDVNKPLIPNTVENEAMLNDLESIKSTDNPTNYVKAKSTITDKINVQTKIEPTALYIDMQIKSLEEQSLKDESKNLKSQEFAVETKYNKVEGVDVENGIAKYEINLPKKISENFTSLNVKMMTSESLKLEVKISYENADVNNWYPDEKNKALKVQTPVVLGPANDDSLEDAVFKVENENEINQSKTGYDISNAILSDSSFSSEAEKKSNVDNDENDENEVTNATNLKQGTNEEVIKDDEMLLKETQNKINDILKKDEMNKCFKDNIILKNILSKGSNICLGTKTDPQFLKRREWFLKKRQILKKVPTFVKIVPTCHQTLPSSEEVDILENYHISVKNYNNFVSNHNNYSKLPNSDNIENFDKLERNDKMPKNTRNVKVNPIEVNEKDNCENDLMLSEMDENMIFVFQMKLQEDKSEIVEKHSNLSNLVKSSNESNKDVMFAYTLSKDVFLKLPNTVIETQNLKNSQIDNLEGKNIGNKDVNVTYAYAIKKNKEIDIKNEKTIAVDNICDAEVERIIKRKIEEIIIKMKVVKSNDLTSKASVEIEFDATENERMWKIEPKKNKIEALEDKSNVNNSIKEAVNNISEIDNDNLNVIKLNAEVVGTDIKKVHLEFLFQNTENRIKVTNMDINIESPHIDERNKEKEVVIDVSETSSSVSDNLKGKVNIEIKDISGITEKEVSFSSKPEETGKVSVTKPNLSEIKNHNEPATLENSQVHGIMHPKQNQVDKNIIFEDTPIVHVTDTIAQEPTSSRKESEKSAKGSIGRKDSDRSAKGSMLSRKDSERSKQGSTSVRNESQRSAQESKLVRKESERVSQQSKPIAQELKPVVQESKPIAQESKPIAQDSKLVRKELDRIAEEPEPVLDNVLNGTKGISSPAEVKENSTSQDISRTGNPLVANNDIIKEDCKAYGELVLVVSHSKEDIYRVQPDTTRSKKLNSSISTRNEFRRKDVEKVAHHKDIGPFEILIQKLSECILLDLTCNLGGKIDDDSGASESNSSITLFSLNFKIPVDYGTEKNLNKENSNVFGINQSSLEDCDSSVSSIGYNLSQFLVNNSPLRRASGRQTLSTTSITKFSSNWLDDLPITKGRNSASTASIFSSYTDLAFAEINKLTIPRVNWISFHDSNILRAIRIIPINQRMTTNNINEKHYLELVIFRAVEIIKLVQQLNSVFIKSNKIITQQNSKTMHIDRFYVIHFTPMVLIEMDNSCNFFNVLDLKTKMVYIQDAKLPSNVKLRMNNKLRQSLYFNISNMHQMMDICVPRAKKRLLPKVIECFGFSEDSSSFLVTMTQIQDRNDLIYPDLNQYSSHNCTVSFENRCQRVKEWIFKNCKDA